MSMKLLAAAILILVSIIGDQCHASSCICRAEIRGQQLCGEKTHTMGESKQGEKVRLSPLAPSYEALTTAGKRLPKCPLVGRYYYAP